MEDTQSQIDEFMKLVLRNLEKNGFPAKAVSFPLDKMYESASRRGFSFNKIRTLLEKQNIATELTTDHVIFRSQSASPVSPELDNEGFDFSNMASMAQKILQDLSPEQMAELEQIMANLKPEDVAAIRQQWEAMPAAEKARMMADIDKQKNPE